MCTFTRLAYWHFSRVLYSIKRMKDRVEDKLLDFLHTDLEPFTLRSLLEYLGEPVTASTLEEFSGYLVYNQLAYVDPSIDGGEELWTSRTALFTGQPCVVTPVKFEIAAGILIPGSRLLPFANPSLLPHEYTFVHKGKELSRVRVDVTPDEAYPLYRLYGDEYTPQYLALDNEENGDLFAVDNYEDPVSFPVTAVDVRDVYWGSSFAPGDRLLAYCRDWEEGLFELEVMQASSVDPERQKTWMGDFEAALTHSLEIGGPGASMDEQLSFAFFLAQESLFTPHAVSVAEFLKWSDKISISYYGVESRLWFTDGDIPAQGSWNMTMISSPVSMLEDAIVHMGLPLTSRIIDSYILDALFRKETATEALLDRLVPAKRSNTAFCVPIIARAVQQRFKHEASDYNWFADHDLAVLRNRYVSLHEGIARFVFYLQQTALNPDDIPEQGAVILGQLMTHTVSALETIDFPETDNPDDIEALWESIEGMEDNFFDTKSLIQEVLPELIKRRFSIIRKKGKSHE